MKVPNIQLLLTGDELMAGDIVDSNSAMVAQQLKELGLKIARKVTVPDNLTLLVNEINDMTHTADILIINGGLGPTVDDLTAQALSNATRLPLTQHPKALIHLKAWCKKRGMQLNEPNLKQTILPQGCHIIDNKCGSAVGFYINHQNCDIYCTPGVPHELKAMLDEQIKPAISRSVPSELKNHVTRLQVFGLGESTLQKLINEKLPNWPTNIELGFRSGSPLLEVKLTTQSEQAYQQKQLWLTKLSGLLGDHLLGQIKNKPLSLAEYVLNELQKQQLKITTAESCTGGLIASMLTQISGCSQNFEVGFVTYSNEIKNTVLDVSKQTLEKYGAVSEETVLAMAHGALNKSQADIVIAVTGIAGPEGGTKEKPVGMVWLAWGTIQNLKTQCLYIPLNRKYFQKYTSSIALDLIRRYLLNSKEIANYITERNGFKYKK